MFVNHELLQHMRPLRYDNILSYPKDLMSKYRKRNPSGYLDNQNFR